MSATVQQLHVPAAEIQGYLDAIDSGRVYGWVWDKKQPEGRLSIEVQLDGKTIVSGAADRVREDLVAGKIGDGQHAFEIELPAEVKAEDHERLVILARVEAEAEPVALGRRPTPALVPAGSDGETIVWLTRILKALEGLGASQKGFQRQMQEALRNLQPPPKPVVDEGGSPLEQSIIDLHTAQQALEKQISGIEVFLLRFDNTLQELVARQSEKPAAVHDRKLHRVLAACAVVGAVALACGFYVAFGGRI